MFALQRTSHACMSSEYSIFTTGSFLSIDRDAMNLKVLPTQMTL